MRCPYCGQRVRETAGKCPRCGKLFGRRKKERQIKIAAAIAVAAILVVGSALLYFILNSYDLREPAAKPQQGVQIAEVTETPTQKTVSPDNTAAETDTAAEETVLSGEITDQKANIDLRGYEKVTVSGADATSTIAQTGVDNSPQVLLDGNEKTSWQEGKDDEGIGETVTLTLEKSYNVRFLVFKLGNWRSASSYEKNNRPENMTIALDGQSFSMTFPDEMEEFCVELSKDCPASEVTLTIDSVYKGSVYNDTCISEVEVYGY